MAIVGDLRSHILLGVLDVQPDEVPAMRHDRSDRAVSQPQDFLNHLTLGRIDEPLLCTFREQRADLFVGDPCAMLRSHPEHP